jgi:hypothetical protein
VGFLAALFFFVFFANFYSPGAVGDARRGQQTMTNPIIAPSADASSL